MSVARERALTQHKIDVYPRHNAFYRVEMSVARERALTL